MLHLRKLPLLTLPLLTLPLLTLPLLTPPLRTLFLLTPELLDSLLLPPYPSLLSITLSRTARGDKYISSLLVTNMNSCLLNDIARFECFCFA